MKTEYHINLSKRLYSKCVEVDNKNYDKPCLNFNGTKNIGNYGIISICNKMVRAHKVSYALSKNIYIKDIPKYNENNELLEVCHGIGCDRTCIEPSHLKLKTKIENNYEDKIRDRTISRGEKNHNSKITKDLAIQIKHSKGDGRTQIQRAKDFNVSRSIVNTIDSGTAWGHIPDKNGNIVESRRCKKRKWRKLRREKVLSKEEYIEALKRIKNNCDIVELEESKHLNSPCWLYKKCFYKYGQISFKGIDYQAHILAYEAVNGKRDLSGDKQVICHKCNIKACCNPEHLYFGTYSKNMIDAVKNNKKGVILNIEKVKEIKKLLKEGKTQKEIAKQFNITQTSISEIKNNKKWKEKNFR